MQALLVAIISLLLTHGYSQCLVAHYPFNGNTNDVSGNGYHATNFGAIPGNDRFGNANGSYVFDGVDDYMDTYTSFDFNYRTVVIWVKSNTVLSDQSIVTQDANSLLYGAFSVAFRGTGNIEGRAGGNGSEALTTNYSKDKWYHIALVRDDDEVRYYLDGQPVAIGLSNAGGSSGASYKNMLIGVHRTMSQWFLNGSIDDIRIFDCALNASQIDSLFKINGQTSFASHEIPQLNVRISQTKIKISCTQTLKDIGASVQLVDLTGRILYKAQLDAIREQSIDVSELASGMFILNIQSNKGTHVTQKINLIR